MLCHHFTKRVNQMTNRVSVRERGAIVLFLSLLPLTLIFSGVVSLPVFGLPTDPPDSLPEPSPSPIPSMIAKDLGEPLFPDYSIAPFGGWRMGSDQPFSLIPVEPNGRYEVFMEIPAPRQEPEARNQEVSK